MKWSKKNTPAADVVMPPVEKKGLFSRTSKHSRSTEDAETVDVISVINANEAPRAAEFDGGDALSRVEPVLESGALNAMNATSAEESPVANVDAETAVKTEGKEKKPLWSKSSKKAKEPKPVKPAKAKSEKVSPTEGPRPLKVLIGYLPDSSERDTYYYMLGVAEKNLDSENIGFAGLTKFETGYAYEIHEGGSGRGFLDSVLKHFKELPAFTAEEGHRAFIRTATRTVRIERTPAGIYSVILPESDTTPQSEWVVPGKKLAPLVEKRTGLFVAGIVIFLSSIVALMGAYATRYQPYTATLVNIERVPVAKLPFSQWNSLTNLSAGDYVMALKFEKGEWLIQTPSNPTGKAGGTSKPNSRRGAAARPAAAAAAASASAPTPPAPAPAGSDNQATTSVTASSAATPAHAVAPTKAVKQRHQQ